MKLKSKLLAGTGTVLMAGSMMTLAAPAAHAAITIVGNCGGSVSLVTITSPTKGVGLGDQTTNGIKTAGALAVDLVNKIKVNNGGACSGVTRPGDPHVPNNNPLSGLTAKAQATVLLGNASCATGPGVAADATAANAYPLNGKVTWTFNQTYVDMISLLTVPYKMQADVSLLGFDATAGPDVVDLGGIVLSGVNAGATLTTNASDGPNRSEIWEDPVAKAPTGTNPNTTAFNTGYNIDLGSAAGCADATPGNANITKVLSGGGGSAPYNTSLLGSVANGLIFEFGQA